MSKGFNWKNYKKPEHKFHAVRSEMDGIKFDSRMALEFYRVQKLDPDVLHIDTHVSLTLPCGIKYRVDFLIWYKDNRIRPVEVKGVIESDFRIKWKQFNLSHPLAPLEVIQKKGKQWIQLEP